MLLLLLLLYGKMTRCDERRDADRGRKAVRRSYDYSGSYAISAAAITSTPRTTRRSHFAAALRVCHPDTPVSSSAVHVEGDPQTEPAEVSRLRSGTIKILGGCMVPSPLHAVDCAASSPKSLDYLVHGKKEARRQVRPGLQWAVILWRTAEPDPLSFSVLSLDRV